MVSLRAPLVKSLLNGEFLTVNYRAQITVCAASAAGFPDLLLGYAAHGRQPTEASH